jgi:hypothetical protein
MYIGLLVVNAAFSRTRESSYLRWPWRVENDEHATSRSSYCRHIIVNTLRKQIVHQARLADWHYSNHRQIVSPVFGTARLFCAVADTCMYHGG